MLNSSIIVTVLYFINMQIIPINNIKNVVFIIFNTINLILFSCQTNQSKEKKTDVMRKKIEKITLGGGCFWCLSPCFEMINGINKVTVGYSGGKGENANYKDVCTGNTGHVEVIEIEYNPEEISFLEILDIFWFLHDPTQLNKQGNDIGTQYKSVIFYRSEEQKILAQESLKKSESSDLWKGKYVTEISPFKEFYPAEDYHQKYYEKNPNQPYCSYTIAPKIQKFKARFNYKLKTEFQKRNVDKNQV
jgi:peptide-methionine (S)-S-oxide reductase